MLIVHHKLQSFNGQDVQGPVISKFPLFAKMFLTLHNELAHPSDITHGHSLTGQVVTLGDLAVVVFDKFVNEL